MASQFKAAIQSDSPAMIARMIPGLWAKVTDRDTWEMWLRGFLKCSPDSALAAYREAHRLGIMAKMGYFAGTVVLVAAQKGQFKVCDFLLANGYTHEINSALVGLVHANVVHAAVMSECPDTLSVILRHFPEDVNIQDHLGDTPLHVMVRHKERAPLARMLLEAGADENAKNKAGHTPLVEAIMLSEAECVKALIEAGVSTRDTTTQTTLPYRTRRQRSLLFLAMTPYRGPLDRSDRVLRTLIECGVPVPTDENSAKSLTTFAVRRGSPRTIRLLAANGVSFQTLAPSEARYDGETPVNWALAWGCNASVVQTLLVLGADPRNVISMGFCEVIRPAAWQIRDQWLTGYAPEQLARNELLRCARSVEGQPRTLLQRLSVDVLSIVCDFIMLRGRWCDEAEVLHSPTVRQVLDGVEPVYGYTQYTSTKRLRTTESSGDADRQAKRSRGEPSS